MYIEYYVIVFTGNRAISTCGIEALFQILKICLKHFVNTYLHICRLEFDVHMYSPFESPQVLFVVIALTFLLH